jgi:hypothetical protein
MRIPSRAAAATSMLSYPTAQLAKIRHLGFAAASTASSIRSVAWHTTAS